MGKRIVINLDAGGGAPRAPVRRKSRRRWPKVLAILASLVAVVVVLVAVGGFFLWRHYQSTPAYSLALLIDAAQRNDLPGFQARIDDEEIAKDMIATVNQKAAGRYGLAMSDSLQQQLDERMSSLAPRLKQTVQDEVAKEIKSFASASESRSFVFLLIAIPRLVTITLEGETARASAPFGNRIVELRLRRDADRWKIVGFKDDLVVQRVVDSVMKDLPAIGLDPKSPLLKSPGKRRKRR